MQMDNKPYKTFLELKSKYPNKMILITDKDLQFNALYHKDHRSLVAKLFKDIGVEVTRWSHNYNSIDHGINPELGLVYLANDSVIVPGLEVHALIGHNARYISEGE